MIAGILIVATALALLAPPGPEGVMMGALFTAALFAGTALAGTFAATALAFTLNVIVGSVISFAINAVVAAVSGKPKPPKVQPFGVQGSLRTGGDVARSFMVGRGMTAGSLVWANAWGTAGKTPNAYLTQVIALSDLPIKGLVRLYVNGEAVTLGAQADPDDAGQPVIEYRRGSTDYLWVKFFDGTQTAASAFVTNNAASLDRPWEPTRVGVGVAYAVVTALFNRDLFTGVPQCRFELDGVALYDPSRDTSVGGSGAHRWDTPSTWDDTTDSRGLAPVILYNLLRGVRYAGEWIAGLQGVAAEQLPAARWIAAIAAARTAGFKAGGEIAFDTELGDTIEALLASCEGRLADNAGASYALNVGAPGAAVASFTDDDIISTSEQSFTPFPGLAETVNGVIFTYPRPVAAWQVTQAPPIYDAALEAEDGGRRLPITIDMPMVSDDAQAQRLAKAALAEARRARRHTLTLPPRFWALEPGDVLAWTSARNGYVSKLFRVDGVVDLPDLDVLVDLTEVDPADYAWDQQADFTPVADGFLLPARPAVQSTSVSVAPLTVTVAGVARRPGIALNWTGAPEDAVALDWQIRLAATGALVSEGTAPGIEPDSSGSTPLSSGLLPATAYEVRARWVPASVRPVAWSSWLAVTTPDVRLGVAEFAAGIEPVGIVAALPSASGYVGPSVVFVTGDGKLYRLVSGAWTAAVDGADLVAASVIAGKIAAGAVSTSELATGAVTADKIAVTSLSAISADLGTIVVGSANIGDLAVTSLKLGDLAVTPEKLRENAVSRPYAATGTALNATIATVQMDRAGYVLAFVTREITSSVASNSTTTLRLFIDGVEVGSDSASRVVVGNDGVETFYEALTKTGVASGQLAVPAGSRSVTITTTVASNGGAAETYRAWALGIYA